MNQLSPKKRSGESDDDFIERVIHQELSATPNVTTSMLKSLRNKLLLTFHPDKCHEDTRYVDLILEKLSPKNHHRYMDGDIHGASATFIDIDDFTEKLTNAIVNGFKRGLERGLEQGLNSYKLDQQVKRRRV